MAITKNAFREAMREAGKRGARNRNRNLTPERRREIARIASDAARAKRLAARSNSDEGDVTP